MGGCVFSGGLCPLPGFTGIPYTLSVVGGEVDPHPILGGWRPFPQSNRAVPYSPHLGGERAGLRPDSCHFAKAFSPHHSSIALGQSDDDLGGFPGRSASEGTNLGDFAQRPAHRVSSCEIRWNVRHVQLVEATLPQELNLQRLSSPIFCW